MPRSLLLLAIALGLTGCASRSPIVDSRLPHRDVVLTAGRKSASYAELVRVRPDGTCEFRFHQPSSGTPADGYFRTTARVGDQIDGGDSDFHGFLVAADATRQTATVREYELGSL